MESQTYDLIVEEDVPVVMRDGVKLSADIYAPARGGERLKGPWPALLGRTPYGKRGEPGRSNAAFFARNGYLVVMQDVRGRCRSEGRFFPFVDEPQDGFDTAEWLSRHPLCDGQIGTYGGSHMAWVQFHMATQRPAALKTMIPHFGPTNAFHHSMREGGALQLWWLNWITRLAARGSLQSQKDPRLDNMLSQPMLQWMARLPWQRGQSPLKHVPEYEDAAMRFMEEDCYNDFWRQAGLAMDEHFANFPDIPILWIGGWYDYYPHAIADSFARYAGMGRKNQYLLMGPWTHAGLKEACGDVHFGQSAAMQMRQIQLAWFDYWLKGKGKPPFERPVNYFLMGQSNHDAAQGKKNVAGQLCHGGKWAETSAWPPPEATQISFYLSEGCKLLRRPSAEEESSTAYTYDPADPVPSVGWCYVQDWDGHEAPVGPRDCVQPAPLLGKGKAGLPLSARRDVLVFESETLDSDLRVAGPVEVRLWVSSDCLDTDFTARLSDVYPISDDYPGGYVLPVAEGILRARFRESMSHPKPLTPGEATELRINLSPTANCFRAGHRLRVDISSSNFPRFEPNRNTWRPGSRPGGDRSVKVAQNCVHHDRSHPSELKVWVLGESEHAKGEGAAS